MTRYISRPIRARVIRHPFGWTFILNGRYSPGQYRTRALARARMAFHKRHRTAFYYAHIDGKAGAE